MRRTRELTHLLSCSAKPIGHASADPGRATVRRMVVASAMAILVAIPTPGKAGTARAEQVQGDSVGRVLKAGERRQLRHVSAANYGIDSAQLDAGIQAIANSATRGKHPITPGMVVMIGYHGDIIFDKGYGRLDPDSINSPRADATTIYDLASVTKVMATTIAVMELADEGKLRLSDRISAYLPYWPREGAGADLRIGHLLVHAAGLGPGAQGYLGEELDFELHRDLSPRQLNVAIDSVLARTARKVNDRQVRPERDGCYTDVAFVALGEIVERVTGERLDRYVQRAIADNLGLQDTRFYARGDVPGPGITTRIARSNRIPYEVNDPIADDFYKAGRVAGNAGLFSSARDLALISQELLDAAHGAPNRLVTATTIQTFTDRTWPETVEEADGGTLRFNRDPWNRRELGFDRATSTPVCPSYLKREGGRCSARPDWQIVNSKGEHELHTCSPDATPVASLEGAFGHLGWTGPSVWIDPRRDMYVIIMMNHRHPHLSNDDDNRHVTLVRRPIDKLIARLVNEKRVSAK